MERIVDTQQAITVAIKPCRICRGGIPETDRFCRLCGESQQAGQTIEVRQGWRKDLQEAPGNGGNDLEFVSENSRQGGANSGPVTEGSASCVSAALVARLSNQLVSGSVACVLSSASGSPVCADAARMKRIVSLLVSVPVWLIIVVLSPFDAYATARLITEARWHQERI
jgi:hypothetical protein